jgi:hypothetical protein
MAVTVLKHKGGEEVALELVGVALKEVWEVEELVV